MLSLSHINTHEKYTADYQHWCPQSEDYAGGDHLLSAFRAGWALPETTVRCVQYWKSGSRPVAIYYFELLRDNENMIMPVISNPYIERYLVENMIHVIYDDDTSHVLV